MDINGKSIQFIYFVECSLKITKFVETTGLQGHSVLANNLLQFHKSPWKNCIAAIIKCDAVLLCNSVLHFFLIL